MADKVTSVNPELIQDIRELIKTGDLSLTERREAFKRIAGRDTQLNDEQLIAAIAATEDDDDNLFVTQVKATEEVTAASAQK